MVNRIKNYSGNFYIFNQIRVCPHHTDAAFLPEGYQKRSARTCYLPARMGSMAIDPLTNDEVLAGLEDCEATAVPTAQSLYALRPRNRMSRHISSNSP